MHEYANFPQPYAATWHAEDKIQIHSGGQVSGDLMMGNVLHNVLYFADDFVKSVTHTTKAEKGLFLLSNYKEYTSLLDRISTIPSFTD